MKIYHVRRRNWSIRIDQYAQWIAEEMNVDFDCIFDENGPEETDCNLNDNHENEECTDGDCHENQDTGAEMLQNPDVNKHLL